MMNKYCRTLLAFAFLLITGGLCVVNAGVFITTFYNESAGKKVYEIEYNNIENTFRENMKYHNALANLYGVFQKAIGHTIVGNFEYVADDDGIIHMINDYTPYQTKDFVNEMLRLREYTDEKHVPLVYVQVPNREISCENQAVKDFNIDDEASDYIVNELNGHGFSVLDLREKLSDESVFKPFELTDLYFHTDLHMQTDAEIWMASQVAGYIKDSHGLSVDNPEYLTDMDNYKKNSYDFIGNYGRTYGDYFVENDVFDIYHPLFPTHCTREIPDAGPDVTEGTFDEAVLNGYEGQPYDSHTYWVTDYGQFMRPYYRYKNLNNADGLKVLILSDSTCYRSFSYMLLTVGEITVLDPRWFNETDYVRNVMEDETFDIAIVWQQNYLNGTKLINK